MLVAKRDLISSSSLNASRKEKTAYKYTRKFRFPAKTVGLLLILIITNTLVQSLVVQRTFEIAKLEKELRITERELSVVRVEIAGLNSYDRIQRLAQSELGMKLARPKDFQRIAAAPAVTREDSQSKVNIWSRLAGLLEETGETMAQYP